MVGVSNQLWTETTVKVWENLEHSPTARAQSIQPKFPGCGSKISLCRMDRDRSERSHIHSTLKKGVGCSFEMKNFGSLLLVLKLDDHFNGDINDIV